VEQYSLKVEILKGIIIGDKVLLPRISFGLSETLQLHFVLTRRQLQTVPTFAVSVKNHRGKHSNMFGFIFSHRWLYVAMSRLRNGNIEITG